MHSIHPKLQTSSPSLVEELNPQNVWIVIPAYNEGHRLAAVLDDLARQCPYHIVVVDDGSRDDTALIARGHGVHVLRHIVNRGQGAALQTGIDFAADRGAGLIVTFDADGQHIANDLPVLIGPLIEHNADLVVGSRFLGQTINMPWTRGLMLRAAVLFTRITTRLRLTDTHNGLRAFRRAVVDKLRFSEDGMAHASEILRSASQHKLKIVEVPVTIRYSTDSLDKGQTNSNALRILGRLALRKILS